MLAHACQVSATCLSLDRDLSSAPAAECSWQTLDIGSVTSPRQLAWAPLQHVQELDLPSRSQLSLSLADGLDANCTWLRRSAQVLVRAKQVEYGLPDEEPGKATEQLDYAPDVTLALAWDAMPTWSCASVLAALAPIGRFLETLVLGAQPRTPGHWRLDADHVAQGKLHLPRLCWLSVDAASEGFSDFTEALRHSTWLRALCVTTCSYNQDPPVGTRDALRSLLSTRRRLMVVDECEVFDEDVRERLDDRLRYSGRGVRLVRDPGQADYLLGR